MDRASEILKLIKEEAPENPMQYVDSIVRPLMIDMLSDAIKECKDCSVAELPTVVKSLPYGDPRASVLVINDMVYKDQVQQGGTFTFPLEGTREGQLMHETFDKLGINQSQLFWMNAINCMSCCDGEKMAPSIRERECCREFLNRAIEFMKPIMIILLGNIPLRFYSDLTISKAHGEWMEIRGIPAMPVFSPHYLVSMSAEGEDFVQKDIETFEKELYEAFRVAQDAHPEANFLLK